MLEFVSQLASQGLGWLVAVLEGFVIYYLFKEIRRINDKRIEDLNIYKDRFISTSKDLLNSFNSQSKSIDKLLEGVDTLIKYWIEQRRKI